MDIKTMLAKASPGEILAAKEEGAAWEDFELFSFSKRGTTLDKLNDIRIYGYKIFIVPDEKRLYDDIAKTIHRFDENGRGEIIETY